MELLGALGVFVISFLLGSIPWGVIISKVFYHTDIREHGSGNIGTTNAMRTMGKVGGSAVFVLDFGKGIVSGLIAAAAAAMFGGGMSLSGHVIGYDDFVTVAFLGCVWGHIFSPWLGFKGGKGIAVTFGCLLGLCLATDTPLKALAFFFLFFSLVLRVSPNFYRTGITYLCALAAILLLPCPTGVRLGFLGLTAAVLLRLHLSPEKREKLKKQNAEG